MHECYSLTSYRKACFIVILNSSLENTLLSENIYSMVKICLYLKYIFMRTRDLSSSIMAIYFPQFTFTARGEAHKNYIHRLKTG